MTKKSDPPRPETAHVFPTLPRGPKAVLRAPPRPPRTNAVLRAPPRPPRINKPVPRRHYPLSTIHYPLTTAVRSSPRPSVPSVDKKVFPLPFPCRPPASVTYFAYRNICAILDVWGLPVGSPSQPPAPHHTPTAAHPLRRPAHLSRPARPITIHYPLSTIHYPLSTIH